MSDIPLTSPGEWINQIPTRPSKWKAGTVSLGAAALVGLAVGMWYFGGRALAATYSTNVAIETLFAENGLKFALGFVMNGFAVIGIACLVAGLLSVLRLRITYWILRLTLFSVYPVILCYVIVAWLGVSACVNAELAINGSAYDRVSGTILWWKLVWPALATSLYTFWLHLLLRSRSVYAAFTGQTGDPMAGDRALEDLRTHGSDPRARRSLYWSLATHIAVIIVIPWLLQSRGCVASAAPPEGGGDPVIEFAPPPPKKPTKKTRLLVRDTSQIKITIPDLFVETAVDQAMREITENRYKSQPGRQSGQGEKKRPGFENGQPGNAVRFIRLDHGGVGWDDGMHHTGADSNFLVELRRATKWKTKHKGESHPISWLKKYRDNEFPAFVYMTGNGSMGRVSSRDRRILREYCFRGGMVIGDAGSASFDRSFRDFVRLVFPDKALVDIPDDDLIYRSPTQFTNGAPPLWHHGGKRALGIKHDGRWVVFYHPGDMNDAWKSAAYTDVTPEMRQSAMQLGINLVYYAFHQWNAAVQSKRKKK